MGFYFYDRECKTTYKTERKLLTFLLITYHHCYIMHYCLFALNDRHSNSTKRTIYYTYELKL